MRAYLLTDGELTTVRQKELITLIEGFLYEQGFTVKTKTIERDELQFCRGCFDCWVKTPGECIMKDGIAQINHDSMTSDVVVYLCPVVFGQFSANMKSAIDRWLPNMLPYFMTRKDGSTMHPPRYPDYPAQIFVGYGEHLTAREMQLFSDINQKHRSNVQVIFDRGDDGEILSALGGASLQRVGGAL